MALIGNNADTLLNGLSAFWHRFFRDIKDIQAVYEGTEILLGQVYLNLLSDVLNTSVVEAPLFRKEFYKLITIREDELVFRERGTALATPTVPTFFGNPGMDRYVYTGTVAHLGVPYLQDVIFSPKAALEEGTDYRVSGYELQFKVDPTDPVLPGYAHRRVNIGIGGKFKTVPEVNWIAAGVEKGDTLYFSETVNLGETPPLDQSSLSFSTWLAKQDGARKATVVHVDSTLLSVSIDTPLPTFPVGVAPSGFSWRVMRLRDDGLYNTTLPRASDTPAPFTVVGQVGKLDYTSTLEVVEISFWAVDARVDDFTLYNTYGYFFTNKQASSEAYRALIRGLMQLYILGPTLARLESALNLTAGLGTIREEGEVLQLYESGILATGVTGELLAGDIFQVPISLFTVNSVGGYIKISSSDYAVNIGTFNIVAYLSPTQVKLKPHEPFIADAGLVWLHTKTNAQTVTTDRNVYTYPLETPVRADVKNTANFGTLVFRAFEAVTTALRVTDYVQDPEWWHTITIPTDIMPDLTADRRTVTPQLYPNVTGPAGGGHYGDPGFYYGQDEDGHTVSPAYRHNTAFIFMDRFLKLHMFGVLVDQSVSLSGLVVTDLQKILKDVKPVHTALYFRPVTAFTDVIDVTDVMLVGPALRRIDELAVIDNQLRYGSAWLYGDAWKYAGSTGGALLLNGGSEYITAVYGGEDPAIQPADLVDTPPGSGADLHIIDRPLYVHAHT